MNESDAAAVALLRRPATIRERCAMVLDAGRAGTLKHFTLDLSLMERAVDVVRDVTLSAYPTLEVPFHSRWRHFTVGGLDRWGALDRDLAVDAREKARLRFDLAVVSVLLDAGAGPGWKYREPATGQAYARSEGLAVASFDAFRAGLFSDRRDQKLRADAGGLMSLTADKLAAAFQVSAANPLAGLDGRAALLRRLGQALADSPAMFGGQAPRIGNLFDYFGRTAAGGPLRAEAIFASVVAAFQSIWPERLSLGGIPLGDVGRHPAARATGPSDGLVPFHKLSQWLTYSLIEPLEDAGIAVVAVDALTGLPEYRNGGLFIDLGVLSPTFDTSAGPFDPLSEPIVEWRALTVTLLDRLAVALRAQLGVNAVQLPVAKVLQGGTWLAGRKVAAEKRPGGGPPIEVISDGTLF